MWRGRNTLGSWGADLNLGRAGEPTSTWVGRGALAGGTLLGRPFTPREHVGEDLDGKERHEAEQREHQRQRQASFQGAAKDVLPPELYEAVMAEYIRRQTSAS
jgi:hypothetical protein